MITWTHKHKYHIAVLSFILIVIGFFSGFFGMDRIKASTLIIATIIAGIPITIRAFQAIRMKAFSIELLVTIAVTGALFIHEYTESSIVTFLFLFGDYLEARTLEKTRSSLKQLIEMAPQEAIVNVNGIYRTIPLDEVKIGDRIIIRSGGKIPVDGEVLHGQASLNEAAITGESIPKSKKVKDKVYSGTIVDNGYLEIIAEKIGEDTTFAKIIELVEEAQESKTKTEKFLNRFSNIYTPTVVLLTVIVYVLTKDLPMAITFLVIACPGALVIGAPASTVAGIGNGAKKGVLIKGGEIMDTFSKVDTLVFDKTGTLTKGRPKVTDIYSIQPFNEEKLLRLVAIAESISEHHLGQTLVKEAKERKLLIDSNPEESEILKGNGIIAKVEGHKLVIGNRKLMNRKNILVTTNMEVHALEREKLGNTAIFAAIDGEIAGIFFIADQIRGDAAKAIEEMRENGIKKVIMLTGDNPFTAEVVAKNLGLDEFYAELLPEQKVEYIRKLKESGHVVAMAGDGINDAPAIATADIGLAMGESGTDISMETADIVLMADRLSQLSHAYSLSKATIKNMKQNTFFAVGIVSFLLFGVLNGSVHLASGMFIHEASVLIVILNGMRLIRFNQEKPSNNVKLTAKHA